MHAWRTQKAFPLFSSVMCSWLDLSIFHLIHSWTHEKWAEESWLFWWGWCTSSQSSISPVSPSSSYDHLLVSVLMNRKYFLFPFANKFWGKFWCVCWWWSSSSQRTLSYSEWICDAHLEFVFQYILCWYMMSFLIVMCMMMTRMSPLILCFIQAAKRPTIFSSGYQMRGWKGEMIMRGVFFFFSFPLVTSDPRIIPFRVACVFSCVTFGSSCPFLLSTLRFTQRKEYHPQRWWRLWWWWGERISKVNSLLSHHHLFYFPLFRAECCEGKHWGSILRLNFCLSFMQFFSFLLFLCCYSS